MDRSKWKREVFTIPNLLSFIRLVLIPVYMHLYLCARETRQFHIAGLILTASCLTDSLDGIIARRFNMISTVGKILDPLADKLTQYTVILCLSTNYPQLISVLALFTVKEVTQVLFGLYYLRRGKILPGALMAGKVCTTVLFTSLILLVFFPNVQDWVIKSIALTDGLFLGCSMICYYFAYWGKDCKIQDMNPE